MDQLYANIQLLYPQMFNWIKAHVDLLFAGTAAIAALITAVAALWQSKRLKTSLQVETLLKLVDRFDSSDYQKGRNIAAISCLSNLSKKEPDEDIEYILDFFDEVAFYARNKVITIEMAWHEFYHYIRFYYQASESYIKKRRKKELAVWEDLVWIYPKLNRMEKNKYPNSYKDKLTKDDLKTFLKQELDNDTDRIKRGGT